MNESLQLEPSHSRRLVSFFKRQRQPQPQLLTHYLWLSAGLKYHLALPQWCSRRLLNFDICLCALSPLSKVSTLFSLLDNISFALCVCVARVLFVCLLCCLAVRLFGCSAIRLFGCLVRETNWQNKLPFLKQGNEAERTC